MLTRKFNIGTDMTMKNHIIWRQYLSIQAKYFLYFNGFPTPLVRYRGSPSCSFHTFKHLGNLKILPIKWKMNPKNRLHKHQGGSIF